uniref:bcl-2-binding component 3-like n=1 Tax=Odobenus rosmarus divergens TaxID=9708 RepID=UPI00063C4978|nr:PREDICTED: bcl-2-binding component 3-like [Odobenus rosmarus divergens]
MTREPRGRFSTTPCPARTLVPGSEGLPRRYCCGDPRFLARGAGPGSLPAGTQTRGARARRAGQPACGDPDPGSAGAPGRAACLRGPRPGERGRAGPGSLPAGTQTRGARGRRAARWFLPSFPPRRPRPTDTEPASEPTLKRRDCGRMRLRGSASSRRGSRSLQPGREQPVDADRLWKRPRLSAGRLSPP